jgi:hypothetical protein
MSTRGEVQVRCPVGPRELLAKILVEGPPPVEVPGNLMGLKCSFCTRQARKADPSVLHVVHCYDFLGTLIESRTECV